MGRFEFVVQAPRRRKTAVLRPTHLATTRTNERWAMAFMHDVLASGQKIRVFTLVDVHTRECVTLVVLPTFRGEDVAHLDNGAAASRRVTHGDSNRQRAAESDLTSR
jgi:putative transposase